MPNIETAAGPIAYAGRGEEGAAAIFLHGAGGSHRHWGRVVGALPRSSRRYAIDLPGHGRSPGPGRRDIAAYGAVVEAAMDALQLEQAAIVGHSMGGAIALWLALERPQRVASLGLVGTGGRLRVAPWLLSGIPDAPEDTIARLVSLLYGPDVSAEMLRATVRDMSGVAPEVLEGDYYACDRFDVLDRLAEIAVPAVVVCGTADRMTPAKYSEYLQSRLQRARLELLPNVGHMPMVEDPEAVARALSPLLGAGERASA